MDSNNSPDKYDPTQQRTSPVPSHPVADTSHERYLNRLSPELRDKIRKLEQIPLLPDWPEKNRGIPNLCLRSALFGVIKRGRRRAVKGELIASLKGIGIRYTGWKLDQGDFDVLVQALHLQNHHLERTPENYIRFEVKTFLRAIGRQPGKSGREWLKDCFRRLTATAIELNVDISNGWTQLQWQQRLHLKSGLAKWLHGFYSSHREPFPLKISTLRQLCGSDCKRMGDFRRSLRKAMNELINVGAIQSWQIDINDKLHVQRMTKRRIARRFPEGA